jgi:hypothetical protein
MKAGTTKSAAAPPDTIAGGMALLDAEGAKFPQ